MLVRLELRSCSRDFHPQIERSSTLDRVDHVTVRRRNDWLPPKRFRETRLATADGYIWRDYVLDRAASDSRGVIVYRQINAQPFDTRLG